MYQLKQMLDDIVDVAYKGDEKIRSYKAFYIEVVDKAYKSRHGDYNGETRRIRLMNVYRDDKKLTVTAIHELAHHINHMQGNKDIHGEGFYANYKKLLHAALDMGLFNKYEYLKMVEENRDSSSENKVKKIVSEYRPRNIDYKNDRIKIIVYGGYSVKDMLKERNFKFNKINKAWELEIDKDKQLDATGFLKENGIEYSVVEANQYLVKNPKSKNYLISVYNSYELRNELKELEFSFRSYDNAWIYRYNNLDGESDSILSSIKKICIEKDVKIKKIEKSNNEIKIYCQV